MNLRNFFSTNEENRRVIPLKGVGLHDGNEIILERNDPYGFWTINFKRGAIPKMLDGQFTSEDLALKAIDIYLGQKKRIPLTTEEK